MGASSAHGPGGRDEDPVRRPGGPDGGASGWEPVMTCPDPMSAEEWQAQLECEAAEDTDPEAYPDEEDYLNPDSLDLTDAELAEIAAATRLAALAAGQPGGMIPGSSSATWPRSGTPRAPAPSADGPPPRPTLSTTSLTKQAAGPVCATRVRSAGMTTGSNSTPAGKWTRIPTGPLPGPRPRDAGTPPNPPGTRFEAMPYLRRCRLESLSRWAVTGAMDLRGLRYVIAVVYICCGYYVNACGDRPRQVPG
jgi:hypothetical protein